MNLTAQVVGSYSANAASDANARALANKNAFPALCVSEDENLIFGECEGSAKDNYRCSADFSDPDGPVFSCTGLDLPGAVGDPRRNNWHIILDMDQSGSMAESIVYGSIAGSIFASLPALKTRVVAFDTEVVDLTEKCGDDPVDMLFGVQLGGGTDINKSVAYCRQFISEPAKTLFFLISDLCEGGNSSALIRQLREMRESMVKVICLLALSDKGTPAYDDQLAGRIAALGIPCFACTPGRLPDLFAGALMGKDLLELSKTVVSKRRS